MHWLQPGKITQWNGPVGRYMVLLTALPWETQQNLKNMWPPFDLIIRLCEAVLCSADTCLLWLIFVKGSEVKSVVFAGWRAIRWVVVVAAGGVLCSRLLLLLQVCLIVPRHQSMNEGHCLIVPMQHVVQATVVDEDVWDEIKVCRVKQMLSQLT